MWVKVLDLARNKTHKKRKESQIQFFYNRDNSKNIKFRLCVESYT